jgi:hypothetical protein
MNCDLIIKDILNLINQKRCENTSWFDIITVIINYLFIIAVIVINFCFQRRNQRQLQAMENEILQYKVGLIHTEDAIEMVENIVQIQNLKSNYAPASTSTSIFN